MLVNNSKVTTLQVYDSVYRTNLLHFYHNSASPCRLFEEKIKFNHKRLKIEQETFQNV